MYSIKNLKSFKGRGGIPCSQGKLYLQSKHVADWSDDANGGMLNVRFNSKDAEAAFLAYAQEYLPKVTDFNGKPYDLTKTYDGHICDALNHMVNAELTRADLVKAAKKGTAFHRLINGEKCLYVSSEPFTAKTVAELRAKYVDLVDIVNETLGLPMVDEAAHAAAEEEKYLRKLCKDGTAFRVPDESGKVVIRKTPSPYSAIVAAQLRVKYPQLIEIINERFL